jgi:hypothetical protein
VVRTEDPSPVRWRAVLIDHSSDEWKDARVQMEIEDWGEPAAYLVRGRSMHLSCDPPLCLTSTRREPESIPGQLGAFGSWIDLPGDVDDVADAAAWVRANIGEGGARLASTRSRLNIEVAGAENPSADYFRNSSALTGQVLTCIDLFDHIAELVDWLDRVRSAVIVPALTAYAEAGVRTAIGAYEQINGPPYGLLVSSLVWSRKNRLRMGDGDEQGWRRMLNSLQSGKLREIGLRAWLINGAGDSSRYDGEVVLNVTLRDQFTPTHEGPLPSDRPAAIVLVVPSAVLKRIENTTTISDITALIQEAAHSFNAVDGYVRLGKPGDRSSSSDEQLWQQT